MCQRCSVCWEENQLENYTSSAKNKAVLSALEATAGRVGWVECPGPHVEDRLCPLAALKDTPSKEQAVWVWVCPAWISSRHLASRNSASWHSQRLSFHGSTFSSSGSATRLRGGQISKTLQDFKTKSSMFELRRKRNTKNPGSVTNSALLIRHMLTQLGIVLEKSHVGWLLQSTKLEQFHSIELHMIQYWYILVTYTVLFNYLISVFPNLVWYCAHMNISVFGAILHDTCRKIPGKHLQQPADHWDQCQTETVHWSKSQWLMRLMLK